uniref:GTP-binding protein Di-Ras2 n=1 Tax=Romanomermis culicivorax TaxID=13658 RepID=A0A915KES1_ROMCU
MPEQSSDYRISIFGAGGVGKSSIVRRFVDGTFSETYVPTIEDTYTMTVGCSQHKICALQIVDNTGSHQFPAMQRLSMSTGDAFVLVYSVTNGQSLIELKHFVDMIREVKHDDDKNYCEPPMILVGNKIDAPDYEKEVTTEMGCSSAKQWSIEAFIETSAKENLNIRELFESLLVLEKRRTLTLSPQEELSNSDHSRNKCLVL